MSIAVVNKWIYAVEFYFDDGGILETWDSDSKLIEEGKENCY